MYQKGPVFMYQKGPNSYQVPERNLNAIRSSHLQLSYQLISRNSEDIHNLCRYCLLQDLFGMVWMYTLHICRTSCFFSNSCLTKSDNLTLIQSFHSYWYATITDVRYAPLWSLLVWYKYSLYLFPFNIPYSMTQEKTSQSPPMNLFVHIFPPV